MKTPQHFLNSFATLPAQQKKRLYPKLYPVQPPLIIKSTIKNKAAAYRKRLSESVAPALLLCK